jgi:membrane-bound lytic murein transglycosylase A
MNGPRWLLRARSGLLGGATFVIFAAVAEAGGPPEVFSISNAQLETVAWSEINGWMEDDHAAAFAAFLNSCKAIVSGTPSNRIGNAFYAALQSVCRRAVVAHPRDAAAARRFFEQNFRPMRIAPLGETAGFLTGYYEPTVEGSRIPTAEFNVPVYRTPPNLALRKPPPKVATANLLPSRWRRFATRNPGFFYDRTAIEEGALAGRNLEIAWLKDPIDLFFAQIQGSMRVRLPDGKIMRLNYDASNGWPYTPIGRFLIERNIVPRDEMSMDKIREWMQANPEEGKELRRKNKSWVFFRETGLAEHEEPRGAQGVALTPGRSIATDRVLHVYGTPFFIEATLPIEDVKAANRFARLMISQDTGGAIVGPARADLYFGAGPGAPSAAGRIRHAGQFTMLIPREIDPVAAGARTPLPRPRPAFAKVEDKPAPTSERRAPPAKKEANTGDARKQAQ